MQLVINPGSGPVNGATEQNAIDNIKQFIIDNGVTGVRYRRIPKQDYGDGRYAFTLYKNGKRHEIQMPGLPIDKVRYVDSDTQNIWHFPRLYVDGSSWVWKFALGLKFTDAD